MDPVYSFWFFGLPALASALILAILLKRWRTRDAGCRQKRRR
ncbi:MAG: hypothetical protein QUS08_04350 [Methanothrix sp.]|nr:hypothetical protein [Methanothrix sp.]